ncbi:MAG: sigma-70 family RNA polymerase sigma factor [Oligella ureolytica]|nr:sigma-70 family RNA polymerase sigma factor [Oligella ureolytica]
MSDEQLNIVRKVVWSYARSTGLDLDFDELCSEAYLAYLEAAPSYDPSRGKKTTFVWNVVRNRINNLLKMKKEVPVDKETIDMLIEERDELGPEQVVLAEESWRELFESLSPDAKMIFFLLNSSEVYINTDKPREARGIIARELKARGWPENKIWATFREIKQVLKTTERKKKLKRTKFPIK